MSHVLGVCPHDVMQDPEKWTAFAAELRARGVIDSSFTPEPSFEKFAQGFSSYTLAYAHPLHAVVLWRRFGFTPIAAYKETFDEAVLIAGKQVKSPSLAAIGQSRVACIHGSPSHAAFLIDLCARSLPSPTLYAARSSYPDVVMAVAQGEADYGVVLNSVWETMMTLRDRVRPFHTTKTRQLVHVFMAAPALKLRTEEVRTVLTSMHRDPAGRAVLDRLGCSELVPVTDTDLERIAAALETCGLKAAA
jgi:hypothetical protein